MITVKIKAIKYLLLFLVQMLIVDGIDLAFDINQKIMIISHLIGLIAIVVFYAPLLNIYEYKEDKEKNRELQKICNVLVNIKKLKETVV